MGELILVRHGETSWSRTGKHTSWTDLPLTGFGEDQARAVAPLLAERRVALTLTSGLSRARRTAELAGLGTAFLDSDLHEWDYGGYEGITTAEIHRDRPEWDLWTDGVVPGPPEHPGETPQEVGERADRVLKTVDAALRDADLDGRGGDVVLVGHAHFLRVLTARRLGLPASAGALFRLDTASVSRLGTEHDRPVIAAWNETPAVTA
ncbi:histidine phosphatase family protein [Streptomyces sp. NPDC051322]|uniref:histidine phosphatase family protein n=1 Tax=Streptomyces sp. NPDC051322 TaxID=3154645 RepID=UPI00344D053E